MASLSLSRLEVASSRMRIRGSARMARAMEILWRCPPHTHRPYRRQKEMDFELDLEMSLRPRRRPFFPLQCRHVSQR